MKNLNFAIIYVGFFALIGFCVWYTKNPGCLWALVLTPSMHD